MITGFYCMNHLRSFHSYDPSLNNFTGYDPDKFKPAVSYLDADIEKVSVLKDNKNKAGIYR